MQDTQFKNQLIDIDLEGKTLPAVTSADDGKVLTVNSSGSWVAAEGGGGGGVSGMCTPTYHEGDFSGLEESINDLIAMLNAGAVPHYSYTVPESNGDYVTCYCANVNPNSFEARFVTYYNGGLMTPFFYAGDADSSLVLD